MARHRISRVIDDHLKLLEEFDGDTPPILVGSAAWYAWLKEEAGAFFAFQSAQGNITARREK